MFTTGACLQGDKGNTGPEGLAGAPGSPGSEGPVGLTGSTGERGKTVSLADRNSLINPDLISSIFVTCLCVGFRASEAPPDPRGQPEYGAKW